MPECRMWASSGSHFLAPVDSAFSIAQAITVTPAYKGGA